MAKETSKMQMRKELKEKQAEAIEEYVKEQVSAAEYSPVPFEVGKKYLIRTVTMVDVGRVTKIIGKFIVLEDASWIADTGRFNECLCKSDVFNEVEPFTHSLFINTQSIIDATPWPYALPTQPK